MKSWSVIKVVVALVLVTCLPLGGALLYGILNAKEQQAIKDRYDAEHAIVFTIPPGASKQFKPIEEQALDLPDVITLTLGLSDTLRIHNADSEPGRVGPFKIDPGLTYRQRFQTPGRFPFVCDVTEADNLMVVVLPKP